MQIPNYVLQARRLNTPSDLPAPPAPNSLAELDRDAWVLQSYVKETRSRAFLFGTAAGFVAAVLVSVVTAQFLVPRLPHAVALAAPESRHAPAKSPVIAALAALVVASAPRPAVVASSVAALPLPSSLPMPPLTPSPAPAPRPAPRVAAQKIEAAHKPADEVEHPPVLANTHGRKEEGHAQVASAKTKAPEPNRVDSARTPVLYVARPARAEQPPETSPRPTDTQQVAKPKPNWTLVGTPTNKFALIAVSGGGGQTVLPVQVGQKLPDGSVLEAVQPGQISTSAGPYFTHH